MGPLAKVTLAMAALYAPFAAADSPASQPKITSVQFSGNGCPNAASMSGSFGDPTITYNRFAAALPGANETVNCEVHVEAAGASSGWQVAVSDVTVCGRLSLDPGTQLDYYTTVYYSEDASATVCCHCPIFHIRGEHRSNISIQTTSHQHISNNGASTIDYPVTLQQGIDSPVWSACIGGDGSPGILNVNFRGALTGEGNAYFEAFTENWGFIWREC